MVNRTSTKLITVSGIIAAIAVAVACPALFAGVAGAQLYPMPFGFDGSYGYPGFDSIYGYPGFDSLYGYPGFDSLYGYPGVDSIYGTSPWGAQQMPGVMPSYAGMQAPYSAPAYPAQQQVPYTQPAAATGAAGMLTIPGLEGLAGFVPGQNKLSLAVVPVTQQNNMLGFQVIGFAISGSYSNNAVVYSLSTPMAGVIDPTQNTLQVDLSGLANNINQAGYVPVDQVYNTIRSGPQVIVIDVDMAYQGADGARTVFAVNNVAIIPPDGRMQAFAMQQPTQLIIDGQTMRIYMVAFPQMINAFVGYYGAAFPQVLPIVYAQPIPIIAPIFVPYLQPFPIFFSSFASFNPFFFGGGFVPFFHKASFRGGFPIHDRDFGARAFSQVIGGSAISTAGVSPGIGPGARITQPGVQATSLANVGALGAAFTQPSGLASARAPGVSIASGAGAQSGLSSVRAPGVSISSGAGIPSFGANIASPSAAFTGVSAPGVSIGSGIGAQSGLSSVRAPGVSIGSGAGIPSITTGATPSFGGAGRGIGGLGGASVGGPGGLGGGGMRLGGGIGGRK